MKIKIKQIVILIGNFMECLKLKEEDKKIIEAHITDLNSCANLFKAYLDACGEYDELYVLQKCIKQEITGLIKILNIEIVENDFLI